MRTTRLRHAALAFALILAAMGVAPLAQAPARPPAQPDALPPLESPVVRTPTQVNPNDPRPRNEILRQLFARPIVRVAQDYTLPPDDVVRHVRSFMGDVTIDGRVERDVVVNLGSARLGPTAVVEGSLVVVGGSAVIAPGASVGHDFVVIGGTVTAPAEFSPGGDHVVVGSPWIGEALHEVVPWVTRGLLWGRLIVPGVAWVWVAVGIFFLLYLALNTVLDRPVAASADALIERPLSIFVAGLLVLVLTVPALAIIAASVIGLAVIPFIVCALVVTTLVGKTAVARAIGRAVLRAEDPDSRVMAVASFVIGFALLTLAYMVPVLGFVTWALTTVLGLGAAFVTFRTMLRRERRVAAPVAEGVPAVAATGAAHGVSMPVGRAYELPPVPPPADVPPPPVYTEGLAAYPRATFLDRVAAFAIDCLLVAIASALLDVGRGPDEGPFFFLLLAYHVAFWAWRGTTLGGIVCNLRVIRTHGVELRFADALVRGLSSIFSLVALGIGCLWMLQDPERQMWHDKIAGTLVVKVPRHLVLP